MKLLKTKITQAALKLFEKLQQKINTKEVKEQLEIKENEEKIFPIYLAGGMAVNFYTDERPSYDLDMECSPLLFPYLDDELIEIIEGKTLYFDKNYNPALGLMHEDYLDNAIPLEEIPFSKMNVKIKPHILSPVDLAISKIARFSDNDKNDIINMFSKNLFTIKELEEKGTEAISYFVGNQNFVKINLKEIIDELKNIELSKKIDNQHENIFLKIKNSQN